MSKKLLIAVVVVVVVVVAAIGIWRSGALSLPPMRTFVSDSYGVSIKYPASWDAYQVRTAFEDKPSYIVIRHPAGIVQVAILRLDLDDQLRRGVLTPEDEVNRYLRLYDASDRTILNKPKMSSIQGHSACSVTFMRPSRGHWHKYIAVKKGNYMFTVSGINEDTLYHAEVNAILNSFRFVGG